MLKLSLTDSCIRSIPSATEDESFVVAERDGVVTPNVRLNAPQSNYPTSFITRGANQYASAYFQVRPNGSTVTPSYKEDSIAHRSCACACSRYRFGQSRLPAIPGAVPTAANYSPVVSDGLERARRRRGGSILHRRR